jgi:hypothetical protein
VLLLVSISVLPLHNLDSAVVHAYLCCRNLSSLTGSNTTCDVELNSLPDAWQLQPLLTSPRLPSRILHYRYCIYSGWPATMCSSPRNRSRSSQHIYKEVACMSHNNTTDACMPSKADPPFECMQSSCQMAAVDEHADVHYTPCCTTLHSCSTFTA